MTLQHYNAILLFADDSADSLGYLWPHLQILGTLARGMSASAAYVEAGYKAITTDALG
jgi:hypothetical protein